MNLKKLARLSALCFIVFILALTTVAQAAPQCGCDLCTKNPARPCELDGQTTTCSYFLAVALCPAPPSASADAVSTVDNSFLTLTSETVQEPFACMALGN